MLSSFKPNTLFKEIASGFLSDKSGWRFKKPRKKFSPANLLSLLKGFGI